jgi:DNA-binding MarR family transcriptional regulator
MITKHDDLLGTLIHDVAHLLRLDIDRRVKAHNLTRIKWLALGVIHNNPGLTQAELASELELGAAAVGRLVDRLRDRNFVVRSPSSLDRRAHLLHLTPVAEKLVSKLDGTAHALREEMLDGLSDRDISRLNTGLNRLKANLQRASSALFAPLSIWPLKPETCSDLQVWVALIPTL